MSVSLALVPGRGGDQCYSFTMLQRRSACESQNCTPQAVLSDLRFVTLHRASVFRVVLLMIIKCSQRIGLWINTPDES